MLTFTSGISVWSHLIILLEVSVSSSAKVSALHETPAFPRPELGPHDRQVLLTVFDDAPSEGPAHQASLSADHFDWKDGKPAGLRGPFVAIDETANGAAQLQGPGVQNPWFGVEAEPDEAGNFLVKEDYPSNPIAPTALGAINAFHAANVVHDAMDRWASRPLEWGTGGRLTIHPHSLAFRNAMGGYELNLGYELARDERTGEVTVNEVARSWDIVAHEAGHAVLYALGADTFPESRPGWAAFHEAFGDITSYLTSLTLPDRVKRLVEEFWNPARPEQLHGLRDSNALSREKSPGEKLAEGLRKGDRDASSPPSTVEELEFELNNAHRQSEHVSAAVYWALVSLAEAYAEKGAPRAEALAGAAETTGQLVARAVDFMPLYRDVTLEDVLASLLAADLLLYRGQNRDLLLKAFGAAPGATPPQNQADSPVVLLANSAPLSRPVDLERLAALEASLQEPPNIQLASPDSEGALQALKELNVLGALSTDIGYRPETVKPLRGGGAWVKVLLFPRPDREESSPTVRAPLYGTLVFGSDGQLVYFGLPAKGEVVDPAS